MQVEVCKSQLQESLDRFDRVRDHWAVEDEELKISHAEVSAMRGSEAVRRLRKERARQE
eukprot:gene6929-33386_t